MSGSNIVFAADPIEGTLNLGMEEVIQAKRKRVTGRRNSIWKTWQEVQAPERSVGLERSGSRRDQREVCGS